MASQLNVASVSSLLRSHPISLASAVGLAVAFPLALRDYRIYLSYGPGGLPYNLTGWLVTNVLRLMTREPFSTKLYNDSSLPFSSEPGYLPANLPSRQAASRPNIGPHPVPQRQLDQLASTEVNQKFLARFEALALKAQEQGVVEIRQSVHERQHKGVFVAKSREWHVVAQETRGEISHIHRGLDYSFHVVLSPADSKEVIEKEWGQRHGLDGVKAVKKIAGFTIPVNYVLIYAPRNDEEIDLAMSFVKASIAFMTGDRGAVQALGSA